MCPPADAPASAQRLRVFLHPRWLLANLDGARRIAFLFREAYKEMGKPMPDDLRGQITGLLAAETPKTESDAGDG
jgi:hypothetical protein